MDAGIIHCAFLIGRTEYQRLQGILARQRFAPRRSQ